MVHDNSLEKTIEIEIAYATAETQLLLCAKVPTASTIAEALTYVAINTHIPGLDWQSLVVGIFGQRQSPDTVLKAGDRIEIYRPLSMDPKLARRARAEQSSRDET